MAIALVGYIFVRSAIAEVLFSDDFEKGNNWELVVKPQEKAEQFLVTNPVHGGKYALKNHLISGEICGFKKMLGLEVPAESITTLSFWYYVPSAEPVGNIIVRVRDMSLEFHDFYIQGDKINFDKWEFVSLNVSKDLTPPFVVGDMIVGIEIGNPNSHDNSILIIDDVILENKK